MSCLIVIEDLKQHITFGTPGVRSEHKNITFAVRETQSLGQQMLERWEQMG